MKILQLTLDMPLVPANITGFRAALAETAGLGHEIFHNHHNASGAGHMHWGYPLIQYSPRDGRAVVMGINEGAEAIRQHLLPVLPQELQFAGRHWRVGGFHVQEWEQSLLLHDTPRQFGLDGWIPFNNENYRRWKAAEADPTTRQTLLNQAITGQLRSMARSLGVPWYAAIHATVESVDEVKKIYWHNVPLVRMYTRIQSCFVPPQGLHVGRMVAYGFGEVRPSQVYSRVQRPQARPAVSMDA